MCSFWSYKGLWLVLKDVREQFIILKIVKKRKRTKHLSCLPTQTSSKYLMKKIFSWKKYSQIINEEEKIGFSLSLILKNPGSNYQWSVTTQQRQPNINVPRLKKKQKKKRTYHLWSSFAKKKKTKNWTWILSIL